MTTTTDSIRDAVARAYDPLAFSPAGYDWWRKAALEVADKVIAAHLSALEAQGYVVVPADPTHAMLRAADATVLTDEQLHAGPWDTTRAEWRAMIASIRAGA